MATSMNNIFCKSRRIYRDEVYAFYIAFILNDGSMSYAYHIPGRDSIDHEWDNMSNEFNIGNTALTAFNPPGNGEVDERDSISVNMDLDLNTLTAGQGQVFHFMIIQHSHLVIV